MIRSMTGFGRGEVIYPNRTISVEIKTINHRYSEYNIRMPRKYMALEELVKQRISRDVSRGKIDVFIQFQDKKAEGLEMNLDGELAQRYYEKIDALATVMNIPNDVGMSQLIGLSGVMSVTEDSEELEEVMAQINPALEEAISHLLSMRKAEGEKLYADFVKRIEYMDSMRLELKKLSEADVDHYREELFAKVKELLQDAAIDEARILQEVAIYADHACVDEENVRLDSHLKQFKELCLSDIPVGRKLDFLCQEINREINTTGSKAGEIEMTKIVVEMKSELEKLREQVQNIE